MFDTLKRLLVGRPLATSEQEHQRITKTIALAVFSSDAISSTAYATEEILFVIAVGAVEPRARALEARPDLDRRRDPARDRRDVVPADDLRLPERRRLLHRQPREPRRECRRSSRARRCSSTTSSRSRCRSRPASPRSSRSRSSKALDEHASRSCLVLIVAHHAREPARHQGVGPLFAFPTYLYIVMLTALVVPRAHEVVLRLVRRHQHDPVRPDAGVARRRGEPAARSSLFLLLRASRPARSRSPASRRSPTACPRSGDRSRRTRRPRSRGWRSILGTLFLGVSVLAHHLQPVSERARSRCSRRWAAGVRRQLRVLDPPARDRRHPHARGQHRLRRLPAAVVDHRPRRLPAAPAREPRRPARVLQRRARARGRRRAC